MKNHNSNKHGGEILSILSNKICHHLPYSGLVNGLSTISGAKKDDGTKDVPQQIFGGIMLIFACGWVALAVIDTIYLQRVNTFESRYIRITEHDHSVLNHLSFMLYHLKMDSKNRLYLSHCDNKIFSGQALNPEVSICFDMCARLDMKHAR